MPVRGVMDHHWSGTPVTSSTVRALCSSPISIVTSIVIEDRQTLSVNHYSGEHIVYYVNVSAVHFATEASSIISGYGRFSTIIPSLLQCCKSAFLLYTN